MENLSHEHADISAEGVCVGGVAASEAIRPEAKVGVQALGEEEAPPPGVWRKIEAQLRREGVIH